jgi:GT2 family glycosyltransferase/glycosyltransferase involved in cell wall biosynthesis/SAM-dependent methyltransferase
MTVERRAGAPRLIDWTGERCVPWTENVQVAYEHYHRYLWAASLTKGRHVLDLGSGEGFGSAILAAEAKMVQGVDVDEPTVTHSQLNYVAPNLDFRVGSALELDAFADNTFDVVVAFEVVEHLLEQERMLEEIDRVLAPEGLLIISTPDRRMYSESTGQDNPFHQRELSEPEFRALLGRRFSHVGLWGQRTMCGSRLDALDPGAGEHPLTVFVERLGDEWRRAGVPAPMYLAAVASHAPFDMPPAESTLVDPGIVLVRQHEREAVLARADAAGAQQELEFARAALAANQTALHSSQHQLGALTGSLRDADRCHRAELKTLSGQLAAAARDVARSDADLAAAHSQLARVDASVAWSAFQFVRRQVYRVIGEHSSAARWLQRVLRGAGRLRTRRRASREPAAEAPPSASTPIRFPLFAEPVVSIVIPVHARADLTKACLRAIAANTDAPTYEVIVIDDAADADNRRLWRTVEGARIIVNEQNLGYLRSVNLAAAQAKGRYVVPLNNDTEVQPGWLSALVECAESAPDIGIVAPKLLYPDGTLQEAGAIIFQDGSGWNYGRGQDPEAATFNYVRDIDYGSGACLLVGADLWRELGGYDELYLPMYYEDTDLCFAARASGCRVVYEPTARVVHIEGGTAGTDAVGGAGKRHQELNRPKFAGKWRDQLANEHLPATPENVRRASNRNRRCHVLVVDHKVPCPDRDSGSLRMNHMLRSLIDIGCRVTFIPDNLVASQPYTRELQEIGIEVLFGVCAVQAEIASIGTDLRLALVSRPVIAPRYLDVIREHAPDAIVAYDTVDLHFVREGRRAALGDGRARKVATLRELELGLIRGSDVTITVTEEEREIVTSYVPDAKVIVIPNANAAAETVSPPASRSGVLFVGSFEHPPNVNAAVALVRTVMPLVWQDIGPVPVKIVGPQPPQEVRELAGAHVEVTGWVKDLTPLYESARMMVAPLQYGAGMKGKVTQSLAAGLPVVTTPIGAEGLEAVDGRDMMIAEDPADLAERIVRLVREDELWMRLSQAGQELASRLFSPAIMRERIEELLAVAAESP